MMADYLKGGSPILLWSFQDAPEELRKLSGHGGDEDFVLFIPTVRLTAEPEWLENFLNDYATYHGDYSTHDIEGGRVYIGAHA
jgi:hypothetical protein